MQFKICKKNKAVYLEKGENENSNFEDSDSSYQENSEEIICDLTYISVERTKKRKYTNKTKKTFPYQNPIPNLPLYILHEWNESI